MTTENIDRNARASTLLGIIGLVASIWILFGVAGTVLDSANRIAALQSEWSRLLLLFLVAFSMFCNFRIATSLRKTD